MLCVHVVDGDDEKPGSVWNPVASPPAAQAPPTAQSPPATQTPASQLLLQRLQGNTTNRLTRMTLYITHATFYITSSL